MSDAQMKSFTVHKQHYTHQPCTSAASHVSSIQFHDWVWGGCCLVPRPPQAFCRSFGRKSTFTFEAATKSLRRPGDEARVAAVE